VLDEKIRKKKSHGEEKRRKYVMEIMKYEMSGM